MPEIPIDIKLPDNIVKKLQPLACETITLPPPEKLNLCLPFGGARLQGIVDVTKAIPDDCAVTFSILLQLPPMMASLGCFIKLLKLMQPLMDFIGGVPNPGKMAKAAADLLPAIKEVVDCFAGIIAGVPMFVKDLIMLIAKLLKCVGQTLKSIAELMGGLQISIKTAEAAGNKELLKQLQCAQDNAAAQAQAALGSVDIIQVLLTLAEPLMSLAPGMPKIAIPTFGSATDAMALEETSNTMLSVASSLETIAKALPSC